MNGSVILSFIISSECQQICILVEKSLRLTDNFVYLENSDLGHCIMLNINVFVPMC